MGILDFFSREAGQERRRALDSLLSQFIPPTARPQFNLLGELNPVVAMERAGQDAQRIGATQGWERVGATGDMLSNMAGVVAPALALRGAGRPVAQAVEEGLLGFSTTPQGLALGDFVADEFGGVGIGAADAAAERGAQIMDMLRSGRADEVTDDMLDMGDPVMNARLNQYLFSNYDLPMDTPSRMARAEMSGNTRTIYHGTDKDINYLSPDTGEAAREGTGGWVTPMPAWAETYARKDGGAVYPLVSRSYAPIVSADMALWNRIKAPVYAYDTKGRTDIELIQGDGYVTTNEVARAARNQRLDAVKIEDISDRGPTVWGMSSYPQYGSVGVEFNPANVRSRFARFDPRLAHLKNLNAAFAAGVPLGLLAMSPEEEQY